MAFPEIPAADTLRSYETLGTVGILLGVLFVFATFVGCAIVWLGANVSRFVKSFADRHLTEMENQTHAMIRIETKQDRMIHTQESWNAYLFCWMPHCPIKNLKRSKNENDFSVQNSFVQSNAGVSGNVASSSNVADRAS